MAEGTDYEKRHRELLLPTVQVQTGQGGGSGTVIYSAQRKDGEHSTYLLTNHHVVSSLISIKEEWSTLLGRKIKTDVKGQPNVNFFEYRWASRAVGATAIKAEIVAYDENEDLALLKLLTDRPAPAVAKLYPKGAEDALRATMPLYAVGAGMGEPPVITAGMLSQFGVIIDHREFWLTTTPIIFGNSGGALFLADTHELIGVPSRVRIAMLGLAADAITHLAFNIPITRVYEFLESQVFSFIFDPTHSEEGDAKMREQMRKNDTLVRARAEERGDEEDKAGAIVV